MSEVLNGKPPVTFWVIGAAALLWNLLGLIVYVLQVTASSEDLAAAYTAEQVAFIESVPKWAVSAFAIAVTTGVLGSLLLLLRKAVAIPVFVLSLVAVLVQNINSYVLNDAIALFGTTPAIIQGVVIIIGLALIFYSRKAKAEGWIT